MNNKLDQKLFIGQITLDDMHREIVREIKVRKSIYPNWIANGRITQVSADYRILVLEAAALKLSEMMLKEKPQKGLFDDGEVF